MPVGFMGAPTVIIEKLINGFEYKKGIQVLEKFLQVRLNYFFQSPDKITL